MDRAHWQPTARFAARFWTGNSVYQRFASWSRAEIWHAVLAELAGDADLEEIFIDSTIVRAHQHAAGVAKKRRSGARAAD
jgi:transposase